jgi:uncharacterized protein YbaA (DUF1428 family)
MPLYVDGFVIPVPKRNAAAYVKMAKLAAKVWIEHGALLYFESRADDVPHGKRTPFPRSVKLKPGEEVWLAWILYGSRKQRDRVMEKAMADKRLAAFMDVKTMPFDGKRMFYGGFAVAVKGGL